MSNTHGEWLDRIRSRGKGGIMRAIDADALRAQFKTPKDMSNPAECLVHITGIWAEIDNAPTITPERKKGKWKRIYDTGIPMLECSVCGRGAFEKEYRFSLGTDGLQFCPYCGADMRETL